MQVNRATLNVAQRLEGVVSRDLSMRPLFLVFSS
jgi:hypothetical protein